MNEIVPAGAWLLCTVLAIFAACLHHPEHYPAGSAASYAARYCLTAAYSIILLCAVIWAVTNIPGAGNG